MRKTTSVLIACTLGLLVVLLSADSQQAQARPKYRDILSKYYPDLTKKHGKKFGSTTKLECSVCHPTKSRKEHNDYGTAMAKVILKIGKKNEKDEDKIKKALAEIEKEKSVETQGKTFGELIKAGKLPGGKKVVSKDE